MGKYVQRYFKNLGKFNQRQYKAMVHIVIYVEAKSKAEINRRLQSGQTVVGVEHKMGQATTWPLSEMLPDGTLVKVWDKMSFGSPVAKSYGRWDLKNRRVL